MEFALVNGSRARALPGWRGCCPHCGDEVIAKCGSTKTWHWAHRQRDCDSWSEGESEWHRSWKALFPEAWQEVTIGEHRADVLTPFGVIELQNSPISAETIQEREAFYGRMIWVVNAERWDLELHHEWRLRRLRPSRPSDTSSGLYHLLMGEDPEMDEDYRRYIRELENYDRKVAEVFAAHKADRNQELRWRWPSKSWLAARKRIYLDCGDGELLEVRKLYGEGRYVTVTRHDFYEFVDAIRYSDSAKNPT